MKRFGIRKRDTISLALTYLSERKIVSSERQTLLRASLRKAREKRLHARPRPSNECHAVEEFGSRNSVGVRIENVRVRKDARDVCLNNALRQRFQPALWPPLGRIRAPDGRVAVHAEDVEPHGRTCRDDKFMKWLTI